MNLFRVRGIQLAVHASFFLLIPLVGVDGWAEEAWNGVFWSVATLLLFFACVILHELGHSFTAMHYGVGVRRILLMPIGGMAEFDGIPRQPTRELLITLAGPAVNFALAGLLWFLLPTAESVPFYSVEGTISQLFMANLAMGIFNLLPAFPMDGGRIFRALLAIKLPYLRATSIAVAVGKILACAGVVVALSAPELGLSPNRMYIVAVLFLFIMFAGEMEFRAVKRRELEDAHLRAVLARLYPAESSPGDPPLLAR